MGRGCRGLSKARYEAIDPDDNLRGAPDLVIEVKSPSNTKRKLQELAALWLADGAGSSIPLTAFGGGGLVVNEIFD